MTSLADRIRAHTEVAVTPLVPELRLHLITERCALWHGTEADALAAGLPEPYWAFCWPGGQALARHLLDHPDLVRGKSVLAFGAGGAAEALATRISGATRVLCADLDPVANAAALLNAKLNDVEPPETTTDDLLGTDVRFDVVLAGDVFYDRVLADRGRAWLQRLADVGTHVIIGDPSRGFLSLDGLTHVASYDAGADGELRDDRLKKTGVYELRPSPRTSSNGTPGPDSP